MSEQRASRQSRRSNRTTASPRQQPRSPAPAPALSRTPTADRRLLRALTGTPDDADPIYDDETPDPNPPFLKAPTGQPSRREQLRNSSRYRDQEPSKSSRQSEPVSEAYDDRNSVSRVSRSASRVIVRLSPNAETNLKGKVKWAAVKVALLLACYRSTAIMHNISTALERSVIKYCGLKLALQDPSPRSLLLKCFEVFDPHEGRT